MARSRAEYLASVTKKSAAACAARRQHRERERDNDRRARAGLTRVHGISSKAVGFAVKLPDGTRAVWRFGEGVTDVVI